MEYDIYIVVDGVDERGAYPIKREEVWHLADKEEMEAFVKQLQEVAAEARRHWDW